MSISQNGLRGEAGAFWRWFLANEPVLRGTEINDDVVSELEARLFQVCKVDWEIGPDPSGSTCFALSAEPGSEHHRAAVELLECAPAHPQWRFVLFKPPRAWNLEFQLRLPNGLKQVDAKRWEFVMYAFEDGSFDVLFKPDPSCSDLSSDTLTEAAIVIVDGEVGEATRRTAFGDIEIVDGWKPNEQPKAALLEPGVLGDVLRRHRR